jgi:apolipoprotein N-acyltransferase
VENGSYLVRAANTGISAVVAPSGAILAETPLFVEAGVIEGVRPRRGETAYARYGDVLGWACVILLAVYSLALLWSCRRGNRRDAAPRTTGRPYDS